MRAVLLFISLFLITCSVQAQENKLIDSLNKVIQSSKNDSSRIDALNKLASRYNYNNPDTSKIISRTAYQLAKKIKYSKGIADSWHVLASSHEVQSLYDSAIFYQEKALEIRKKINDKYGVSSSLNNMGTAYYHKGNHNKAIELYIASANMDEELNDLTGVASSYNNIGLIYWGQNNLEKANEYFTLTYNIFKRLKDDFGIAGALSNLGGIAYTQKRIEASLDYFLRSLMLYEKVQKEQYIALICSNIGEVYSELKRYPEAIPYIKRAIAYQYKIGDAFGLINSQLVLAKLQSNTKNYLAAESTLKLIIQKSDEIQANTQKVTALEMLADVYAGSNNYKDGFYTFKQFWALKDTLNKIEKSNQINDVSANYETDKKNKENELLKKSQEISELQQ
ncbi:MAG: tetratricopeptide repeat protein [Bacteroidia bacterium]